MGMLQKYLGWLAGAHRIRRPTQYIVQAASGERSGVEERLDDFRGLGGIEAGSVVAVPTAGRGLDRAGGESFSARSATIGSTHPATGSHTSSGSPAAGRTDRVSDKADHPETAPENSEEVIDLGDQRCAGR
jgi:hypothetical protein